MGMFCNQCEQAANGVGCNISGVCGKKPDVATLQDLLIHALKGVAVYANNARELGVKDASIDRFVVEAAVAQEVAIFANHHGRLHERRYRVVRHPIRGARPTLDVHGLVIGAFDLAAPHGLKTSRRQRRWNFTDSAIIGHTEPNQRIARVLGVEMKLGVHGESARHPQRSEQGQQAMRRGVEQGLTRGQGNAARPIGFECACRSRKGAAAMDAHLADRHLAVFQN